MPTDEMPYGEGLSKHIKHDHTAEDLESFKDRPREADPSQQLEDKIGKKSAVNKLLFTLSTSLLGRMAKSWFKVLLVCAWYSSNIGVLLLNKALLTVYHFKYPVFLTLCHMTMATALGYLFVHIIKIVPRESIKSRQQAFKIGCLSTIFVFSIVAGNVSLRYIPVSFNQAIGATTPFFTALFSALITMKKETFATYLALIPVVMGVVIASEHEPLFNLLGFCMCLFATSARALKTVLQGLLLTNEGEKLNSINLLMYIAPIACMILLPASLVLEGNVAAVLIARTRQDGTILLLLTLNSLIAYCGNITNFLVTRHTSPLTLQVLGNAKGAVAVVISILLFRNPVTLVGMVGYGIAVTGVILYGEAKKRGRVVQKKEIDEESQQPLIVSSVAK